MSELDFKTFKRSRAAPPEKQCKDHAKYDMYHAPARAEPVRRALSCRVKTVKAMPSDQSVSKSPASVGVEVPISVMNLLWAS